jgi:serine/threonine protein kinase
VSTAELGPSTTELKRVAAELASARRPEDIFGLDPDRAQSAYRRLARAVYPDLHPAEQERATDVFKSLGAWWALARQRLERGSYGTPATSREPLTFVAPSGLAITLGDLWRVGDIADLYRSTDGQIVKIARDPRENSLLRNEAETLRHLARAEHAEDFRLFVPKLVESFSIRSHGAVLAVNVLSTPSGLHSLREVLDRRGPLDPRDMTWIFRRLLKALAFAHRADVIHGAVVPAHVLIHPDHGLTLVDWCYAVPTGAALRAIPTPFRDLYPEFVFSNGASGPGLDIFMAAKCMVLLLGGNPKTGMVPETINPRLRAFFSSWGRFGPDQAQDAAALLEEYTELVESLWPRAFRPFSMPPRDT